MPFSIWPVPRYVKSHAGWTAKRTVATEEEKKKAGEKRKGKCYFVSVKFTCPLKGKKTAKAKGDAGPPAKKQKVMGEATNSVAPR